MALLRQKPAPVSCRLDADLFVVLLKAAAAVARQDDGKAMVDILLWNFDKPIGVAAQGPDGVYFDGLIQPLG